MTPALWCPCTGKVCRTRRGAKREARRASRRTRFRVDHFYCPDCGAWHLGKLVALYRQEIERRMSA
jgi:hypothetical protein